MMNQKKKTLERWKRLLVAYRAGQVTRFFFFNVYLLIDFFTCKTRAIHTTYKLRKSE